MTALPYRVRAALPVLWLFAAGIAAAQPPMPAPAVTVVSAPAQARPRLSVPATAVVQRGGLEGVFVVDPDGRARFRMVRTGRRNGQRVEILAGLFGGEALLLDNLAAVRDGAPANPHDRAQARP